MIIRAVFILLAVFVSGCGGDGAGETSETLVVAFDGAPVGIDPGATSSAYAAGIVQATYETLFEYKYLARPLELVPSLSDGWPSISEDGLIITITLAADSRFADNAIFPNGMGRVVTANDVAYSILRHFDERSPAFASWLWRDVIDGVSDWDGNYDSYPGGIEVVDDRTIVFRLTQRTPRFLHTLATAYASVIPVESREIDLNFQTVGSGPYRLSSIDSERAVLVENENYRSRLFSDALTGQTTPDLANRMSALNGRRLPLIPRIEVEFVEDSVARWLAFDNGQINVAALSDQFLDPLLADKDNYLLNADFSDRMDLHPYIANEVVIVLFRMDQGGIGYSDDPVENERNRQLRCAISSAIDWSMLNEAFFGNDALVYQGIVPPTVPGFYRDSGAEVGDSIQLAQILRLFEAEGAEIPTLTYGLEPSSLARQNFDLFKSMLVQSGYPADMIEPVTYASFGAMMNGASEGKHLVTQMSWSLDVADPTDTLQLFYGPNASPGANTSNYADSTYDSLYEQLAVTGDLASRDSITAQMQGILLRDCPYSGTLTRERVLATSSNIVALPSHDSLMIGRYFKYVAFDSSQ